MWLVLFAWLGVAEAAEMEHRLVWDVTVGGRPVGTRELTVKYQSDGNGLGMRRILETYTEIDASVGPAVVRFRQRMTAHASGRAPASFHSVVQQDGTVQEIQGRWTPSSWAVTTTLGGRSRTVDLPLGSVDLSTADLLDPDTRFPLAHFDQLDLLSAETGEVLSGRVESLGSRTLRVGGEEVLARGYAWASPQGRSEFWYSADGFLVQFRMPLFGFDVAATLRRPPPGGVDDFPVSVRGAPVEILDL